jgi:hypothetical protein
MTDLNFQGPSSVDVDGMVGVRRSAGWSQSRAPAGGTHSSYDRCLRTLAGGLAWQRLAFKVEAADYPRVTGRTEIWRQ